MPLVTHNTDLSFVEMTFPAATAPPTERDVARRVPCADSPRTPGARREKAHEPMISAANPGAKGTRVGRRFYHLHSVRVVKKPRGAGA